MQKSVEAAATARPLWIVVLAAGTVVAVAMGLRQVMGLYLIPMTTELGIGREPFSSALANANLVWGLAAVPLGAVSDRYGTGRVVLLGVVCTMLGLYSMYMATTPAMLELSGLLLGIGIGGTGVTALVGAVGRVATTEQRPAALASLGMAAGIGGFIAFPYASYFIQALGWKQSLLVLVATAALLLPLAAPLRGRSTATGPLRQQTLKEAFDEAFRLPSFWLLVAGFFVCGFHVAFYSTHLPAFVADHALAPVYVPSAGYVVPALVALAAAAAYVLGRIGYGWLCAGIGLAACMLFIGGRTWNVAVLALSAVGITNIIGTFLAGQSSRFVEKRYGLAFIYFMRVFGFLGLLFLPINAVTVIGISAILGFFWLSTVPLTSAMVATFFGPQWMSMLFGFVFLSHQVGSFAGLKLAGVLYDATKSYTAMWWISVALALFAAVVHLPIRERGVPRLSMPPKPATAAA